MSQNQMHFSYIFVIQLMLKKRKKAHHAHLPSFLTHTFYILHHTVIHLAEYYNQSYVFPYHIGLSLVTEYHQLQTSNCSSLWQ